MNKNEIIVGQPVYIEELDAWINQPTMREILAKEAAFMGMLQIFTVNPKAISLAQELEEVSEFMLSILLMYGEIEKTEINLPIFLSMIFPDYRLVALEEKGIILVNSQDKLLILNELNFNILKEALRDIFYLRNTSSKNDFNPEGDKARAIAEKLKKARMRASEKRKDKTPALSDYVTILVVGLEGYTIEGILDLTMYQFSILLERFTLYYNFSIDLDSRLAGATPKEDPDNWMKNLIG